MSSAYFQVVRGCGRIWTPAVTRLTGNICNVRTASQDSSSDTSTKPKTPKSPPKEPKKEVKRESAPAAEPDKGTPTGLENRTTLSIPSVSTISTVIWNHIDCLNQMLPKGDYRTLQL
ncbi:unnamed protein product [Candidula unifasciata]|uniref:Uncharacterized protein n=1 Tax=Candidula unifasciata TaxID=100452 RepID=A0A8S3YL42_9EUPU|nr:unnamed protein product [Candidula unifasciata]